METLTRTQECRSKLAWIETNCPLDRTSIIPIKKAAEFCDKHVEISTLSTDAIQPLIKVRDEIVQERALTALKTMIDSGKKPTKTIVKKIIIESIRGPRREELVHRGETITEEKWREVVTPTPHDVILRGKITERQKYIEQLKEWIAKCENDIAEYQKGIKKTEEEILRLQDELAGEL